MCNLNSATQAPPPAPKPSALEIKVDNPNGIPNEGPQTVHLGGKVINAGQTKLSEVTDGAKLLSSDRYDNEHVAGVTSKYDLNGDSKADFEVDRRERGPGGPSLGFTTTDRDEAWKLGIGDGDVLKNLDLITIRLNGSRC